MFTHGLAEINQQRIIELAARERLPTMYGWREFVIDGGLHVIRPQHPGHNPESSELRRSHLKGRPLHARLVAELRALRHKQGRAFRTNAGLPYAEKESGGRPNQDIIWGACRRAGIEDFSPHDCRHTWATWHYAANRDLIALMKLGGWKSERMVLRYAHVNVSQLAPSIAAGLAAWDTKSAPSEVGESRETYGGSNRCVNLRAPLVRERS